MVENEVAFFGASTWKENCNNKRRDTMGKFSKMN
jgi:hypothetical protein